MGLFDFFRNKKQQPPLAETEQGPGEPSLKNFQSFYLYGFTNNPSRQSTDINGWGALYHHVIGTRGGIIPGGSFHPYQLVNAKGTTAWQASYVQVYANEKRDEVFRSIASEDAVVWANVTSVYKDLVMWPDTRLSYEENPVFGKYVPFVIPFLCYRSDKAVTWDHMIQSQMAEKGHASGYLEEITKLAGFLMHPPSFIVGFDEFDETNPSKLIDNFISCKKMFGVS
jgi:hypothetical protein